MRPGRNTKGTDANKSKGKVEMIRYFSTLLAIVFIPIILSAEGNEAVLEGNVTLVTRVLDELTVGRNVHPSDLISLKAALKECGTKCPTLEIDLLRKAIRAAEAWNLPTTTRDAVNRERLWSPVALVALRQPVDSELKIKILSKSTEIIRTAASNPKDALRVETGRQIEALKKEKPRKLEHFMLEGEYLSAFGEKSENAQLKLIGVYADCLRQDKRFSPCRERYDALARAYTAIVCKTPIQVHPTFLVYTANSDKSARYPRLVQDEVGRTYYSTTSALATADMVSGMNITPTDYGAVVALFDWKPSEHARIKKRLKNEAPRYLLLMSESKLVTVMRARGLKSPHTGLSVEFAKSDNEREAKAKAFCIRFQRKLPKFLLLND